MRKGLMALAGSMLLLGTSNVWAGDARPEAPAVDGTVMFVQVQQTEAKPGDIITVDVYINNVANLSLYQVQLKAVGGERGRLIPEQVEIQKTRRDYVLGGTGIIEAADQRNKRAGGLLMQGSVDVTRPAYLATFTYRVSSDAAGTFKVNINRGSETFISDQSSATLSFGAGADAKITVTGVAPKRSRSR